MRWVASRDKRLFDARTDKGSLKYASRKIKSPYGKEKKEVQKVLKMRGPSLRKRNLWKMGFVDYQTYLKSPLWYAIRAKVMARAEGKCEFETCGAPAQVVHHLDYELETLQGDRLMRLIACCAACHDKCHATPKRHGRKASKTQHAKYARWAYRL